MPKLARDYYSEYHNYNTVYSYSSYARLHRSKNNIQKPIKPLSKPKKKKNFIQIIISFSLVSFLILNFMPFSYKTVTKAIFEPTPYNSVKSDMHNIAFPTHNYLSNNWFGGVRDFNYSASGKDSQMLEIKENVNMPLLEQELINLSQNYQTVKPSIYVWDYETGNYVDINATENYAAASIIKIPVLIDLFKSIEAGQLSLDDKIPLKEHYRTEGSGNLQYRAENSEYTVDELARIMITDSDNSATNMLMAKTGSMTGVNTSIRNWGLKNTFIQSWLPDLGGTNRITAKELGTMLYNIDENEDFLSDYSRAKIFDYMGHVHNDRLIQAGLGKGAKFFHKTGDIGTMLGDAGIVIAPNGKKYIVVILATRPHNSFSGKEFIVNASEIIYNYMVR